MMQLTWSPNGAVLANCHWCALLECGNRRNMTFGDAYDVHVMKMGNTVPRVGIEPTSLSLWASVLSLHHIGFLMSPQFPHPLDYAAPCLRGQCRLLHQYRTPNKI